MRFSHTLVTLASLALVVAHPVANLENPNAATRSAAVSDDLAAIEGGHIAQSKKLLAKRALGGDDDGDDDYGTDTAIPGDSSTQGIQGGDAGQTVGAGQEQQNGNEPQGSYIGDQEQESQGQEQNGQGVNGQRGNGQGENGRQGGKVPGDIGNQGHDGTARGNRSGENGRQGGNGAGDRPASPQPTPGREPRPNDQRGQQNGNRGQQNGRGPKSGANGAAGATAQDGQDATQGQRGRAGNNNGNTAKEQGNQGADAQGTRGRVNSTAAAGLNATALARSNDTAATKKQGCEPKANVVRRSFNLWEVAAET